MDSKSFAIIEKWKHGLTSNESNYQKIFQEIFIHFHVKNTEYNVEFVNFLTSEIKRKLLTDRMDKCTQEVVFRTYYRILHVLALKDEEFLLNIHEFHTDQQIFILQAALLAKYHQRLNVDLQQKCIQILNESISVNSKYLSTAIHCSRLLEKNTNLSLKKIYFCMQSHSPGAREEVSTLFELLCCNSIDSQQNQRNEDLLNFIICYWPWTNKNKMLLLSVLLKHIDLMHFLRNNENISIPHFLNGVRLSLIYKNLFSPGQFLIKSIQKFNLPEFKEILIDIIQAGSQTEITNLSLQWFSFIENKEDLFIDLGYENGFNFMLTEIFANDLYRMVVITHMFQQQINKKYKFSQVYEFFKTCSIQDDYTIALYAFRIIIDSMLNCKQIEECKIGLDFITNFINANLFVPCSTFRYTVLNRLTQVFDFIAKRINTKIDEEEIIAKEFFIKLRKTFKSGILRTDYQPLIFGLKIFEIFLKSLMCKDNKRINKNSNVSLNKKLGNYLNETKIWPIQEDCRNIFNILELSAEYDDVRDLILNILIEFSENDFKESLERMKDCNESSNIDVCCRSICYAKICATNCDQLKSMHREIVSNIQILLDKYTIDPLQSFKNGQHIFGLLNSLNEFYLHDRTIKINQYHLAINLAEQSVDYTLALLNKAGHSSMSEAPSFQVMDESLEILVSNSEFASSDHDGDRKFMLLSFWLTLKASCDLVTTIGVKLIKLGHHEFKELEDCLRVNTRVLRLCRHKGAIEAAGLSLGKLVKQISNNFTQMSHQYNLLYSCLNGLFKNVDGISLTRRGAGLSIMFHHLLKNDVHRGKPLLHYAVKELLNCIKEKKIDSQYNQQRENFDALVLNYLCVLVKDTDLKSDVSEYYDDIMMASMMRIEEKEWTVRNGALQLFGALTPKIIGQKQPGNTDLNDSVLKIWKPTETTFCEVSIRLPKTIKHMLEYCSNTTGKKLATSSIILFLEFLSSIEYIKKDPINDDSCLRTQFKSLFWKFLFHECEKIRKLSALCLARFHEFRNEIPNFILNGVKAFFAIDNENFRHGLLLCFIQCINKYNNDSQFTNVDQEDFFNLVKHRFYECYKFRNLSFLSRLHLISFFQLCKFDFHSPKIVEILCCEKNGTVNDILKVSSQVQKPFLRYFGFDLWREKVLSIYLNFKLQ